MVALERTLQLGISEELAKLERSMNWLATTATVTPFIGLFGTVWGIIASFQGLGQGGQRQSARGSAGYLRGAGGHRHGTGRRHSGRHLL